ncbi:MAG: hypothetical protein AB8C13_10410 [Phycisphaerales bacterium]
MSVIVMCMIASICIAGTQPSPWRVIDKIPEDVDLVFVIEDSASILLSSEGAMSRTVLGSMGQFSQTQNAWRSLSGLFGTDINGVIHTLMSGRVLIAVDSVIGTGQDNKLMDSIDNNWVVVADVQDESLSKLREKLKPVPRQLVDGVPVYGIEQGRYSLIMLKGKPDQANPVTKNNTVTTNTVTKMLLAPKGARGLLERVLDAVKAAEQNHEDQQPARELVYPVWNHESLWSIACRVRVDEWVDNTNAFPFEPQLESREDSHHHVRAVMGGAENNIQISMAMAYGGGAQAGNAPVGLLTGLDDDVVIASACSSVLKVSLDPSEGLSIRLRDRNEEIKNIETNALLPEGSLVAMRSSDIAGMMRDGPSGMTMLMVFPELSDGGVDATQIDALIEPLIFGSGASSLFGGAFGAGSTYNGAFPGAIRTQVVRDQPGLNLSSTDQTSAKQSSIQKTSNDQADDDQSNAEHSKSTHMEISWKATERLASSDLILSIFSSPELQSLKKQTFERAKKLDQTVSAFDAIGEGFGLAGERSVVTTGFIRLKAALASIPELQGLVGLGMMGGAGDGKEIRWEVVGDDRALYGTVSLGDSIE